MTALAGGPATASTTEGEWPNLDLLRAFAVMAVFAGHLLIQLGFKLPPEFAATGVLVFFFHTCLVLMMSLSRLEARGESLTSSFYVRRFFRIYPLAIVVVSAVAIWHLPRAPWWPQPPLTWSAIAANLTLTMNLIPRDPMTSVLWSLPLEVQMYVVLPFLYLLGRRYGFRAVLAAVVLSWVVGRTLPRVSARFGLALYGPAFMSGVLAYFLGYGIRPRRLPFWILPATVLTLWMAFSFSVPAGFPPIVAGWILCYVIAIVAVYTHELTFAPVKRVAALIARYSYGIYLTHLFAIWIGFVVLKAQPAPVQWIATFASLVAMSVILYHTIEAPLIRVGARIAKRYRARDYRRPPQSAAVPTT